MSRFLKIVLGLVAASAGAAVVARLLAPPVPRASPGESDAPLVDDLTEEEQRMLLEELDAYAVPPRPGQT